MARGKVLALAPEMLEALIDADELIKREFLNQDHPLAELLHEKIKSIIARSFHEKNPVQKLERRTKPSVKEQEVYNSLEDDQPKQDAY